MIHPGDTVRISKLDSSKNPKFRTAQAGEWADGDFNADMTPPVDYTVEGWLTRDVTLCRSIHLYRTKRNDVEMIGYFNTSPVRKLSIGEDENTWVIETENSVYLMSLIRKVGSDAT